MFFRPGDYEDERGWQDTALVCLSGHMVNHSMKDSPQWNTKFCQKCGEGTISQCPSCRADILGDYHFPNVVGPGPETPLSFCHNCGMAYPWTETKIAAAKELISLADTLSLKEKEDLGNAVSDLARQSPRTEVAALKLKKYTAKAGKAIGEGIWRIALDVATEAAKKILLPTP